MSEFTGLRALVTGGASGIGLAVAVNVVGLVRVTRAALPALRQSQHAGSTTGTWLAVDGGMDRLRLRR